MSLTLKSGYPYSLINFGLLNDYPKLQENIESDVVIIGGGISGALTAYTLIENNINCVLVDARSIGLGSTCASTSLIQYELDVPLYKLIKMIGREKAITAYQLCRDNIYKLEKISDNIGFNFFKRKKSLFFASSERDKKIVEEEYKARKEAGINVEYLDEKALEELTGSLQSTAILSHDAAEIDAYTFTHSLLQFAIKKGLKVFDKTKITENLTENGKVKLRTEDGYFIKAKKVIYATGYEAIETIGRKYVQLSSTYAFASEQMDLNDYWFNDYLLWETAIPYCYLRTAPDNRILFGGKDEKYLSAKKNDKLIDKKALKLVEEFKRISKKDVIKPEFSWTGIFGSTKDGLPYIGEHKKAPDAYFALGFGGNGIIFSVIAAEVIKDLLMGKENKYKEIFSFYR